MIGKIGSADLAASTDTLLGMCNEDMVVNVRVANRGTSTAKINIAIGTGTAPALSDYISFGVEIDAGGVLEESGLALSPGEKIWVRSDVGNVSARAHGLPVA